VSLLSPTRKVTDPKGHEWELYVSRYAPPKWKPSDYDSPQMVPFAPLMLLDVVVAVPAFLYHEVLVPILRFLVMTPYLLLAGRRSQTVWIEAIMWDVEPFKESYLWTTTPAHADRVLDQIVRGLAAGELARPLGGAFQGRSST
jgi:hypothetical protein